MAMRNLTVREKSILERMLRQLSDDKDPLRAQASAAEVKTIDDEGSLDFSVPATAPRASAITERVPVTATFNDEDGTPVYILLHLQDGRLSELEVYKADGSKILRQPVPEELYF